jgi:hypothetical protein
MRIRRNGTGKSAVEFVGGFEQFSEGKLSRQLSVLRMRRNPLESNVALLRYIPLARLATRGITNGEDR